MSSCMIIQEHDRFTFSSDTARCWGDNNLVKYRCYGEKVQKVYRAGLDMIFIAGMTECTEQLRKNLYRLINKKNHLNIELLKQYLKREFPQEKSKYSDTGLSDIGATVFSVVNNESILYCFDQFNNFNGTLGSKARHGEIKLFATGFDGERIYTYALGYIKSLKSVMEYRKPDTFIHVYQNNYSEGVGGYIQIYSMDCTGCKIIKEHQLNEEDLRYCLPESTAINPLGISMAFSSHIIAGQIIGGTISGTAIDGVNITGGTITGTDIISTGSTASRKIEINNGNVTLGTPSTGDYGELDGGSLYFYYENSPIIRIFTTTTGGNIEVPSVVCSTINGALPINENNLAAKVADKSVAYATSAMNAINASAASSSSYSLALRAGGSGYGVVYVSTNNNFRPQTDGGSSCGTSDGRWSSVWALNGTIQTSDVNKKNSIQELDERYMQFVKKIIPKSFKMNEGTSGRIHLGFIAQDVETAMAECGISDMEFAGLIKAPVYSKKLLDKAGNELPEYDTTSEIIGYDYGLRYDEFIPLLFARIIDQEERLCAIEKLLSI